MLQLRYLDPSDVRGQRAYRLQVKERLFRFNYVRSSFIMSLSDIRRSDVGGGCVGDFGAVG